MSRPLVIYHGNCADGFGAAWCFWHKYGEGADYVAGVYQTPPPDVTGRDVYLVDFSYKKSIVEKMFEIANTITLLDHHKTAIDDLQPLFAELISTAMIYGTPVKARWGCDLDHSGAMIAWQFLFPGERPPLLLGHIEDRDLWRFKLPGTREIQANLFSHPYDFALWDKLMFADQVELLQMTAAGAAIERKHHKDIAELIKASKRTMVIANIAVPVANLPYTMSSDAGHIMAQGEAFAACYMDTPWGRSFSLRSADNGHDVSEVARLYGGGGHARAAGFTVAWGHPLTLC